MKIPRLTSTLLAPLMIPLWLTPAAAQPRAPAAEARHADSPVTEAQLRRHMAYLADDALQGRFPGTSGETLTAHYIAIQLAAAGFVGGMPDGSWYQPVPLVTLSTNSFFARFNRPDGSVVAVPEITLRGSRGPASVDNAPVIYVGHGVDANGRVVADVRGKVALLLVVDRPGEGALNLTARRDALIAAGARATLMIAPSTMSFGQVQRSFAGRRMQLESRVSRAEIDGMLSAASGDALLASGGTNAESLRNDAANAYFVGLDLPVTASLSAQTDRQDFNSYNVIARLPGRRPDSGTVVLMGHWDHLGVCRPEGEADRICNGAVDNASGIAVLLEVGARLGAGARAGAGLDRDTMVVATTAEEQGLLGAFHFAASPPVPLDRISVALNVDTVAIAGRNAPMAVIGRVDNPVYAAAFEEVGRSLGRGIDSDIEGEAFVRRQDGWALTQAGVPSLMAGGSFSDMAKLEDYLGGDYHGPADQMKDSIPLGGAADDADLHLALTRHFGSLESWPLLRGTDN
ncbi:M28 family peptidase [Sphingomonas lacunae]|uniref:M28 family peptidase n=1 Tax=Sphingomonas lacunae TaxID=2698828 RepID=A0A6M4AUA2_9SPHN|nr:M28 family peptidase [Sphingomonas lacunae]QJQ32663.1 M28 family peptidase [Sphingomonas lacunae]